MDLFISVPLVLMEPENERKKMYGKAGAYRNQPWGVEYRSSSNFIFSSPELMKWAFNQTLKAIEFVNSKNGTTLLDSKKSYITRSINENNKDYAKYLIELFEINCNIEEKVTV